MTGETPMTPGAVLRAKMADDMMAFWPDHSRDEILRVITEAWHRGMEGLSRVLTSALRERLGEPVDPIPGEQERQEGGG